MCVSLITAPPPHRQRGRFLCGKPYLYFLNRATRRNRLDSEIKAHSDPCRKFMKYYAKLLWLGEYSVIRGSHALASPYPHFSGRWQFAGGGRANSRQQQLPAFAAYLESLEREGTLPGALDWRRFQRELAKGLYFDSDIPTGYGLGSSGALCAAVYHRYARKRIGRSAREHYGELREQLARLESFFHGSSSGADPLICYLNQPVLLLSNGKIQPTVLPNLPGGTAYRFFLLDTRRRRQTGPLVNHFVEACRRPSFANHVHTQLIPRTNRAIQSMLAGDWPELYEHWAQISDFQWEHFQRMIPDAVRPVWNASLCHEAFSLKLCGAGGGGYLLGFAADYHLASAFLKEHSLQDNTLPLP